MMMNFKVKILECNEDTINKFIESDECGQLLNVQPLADDRVLIMYSPDKPQPMFGMPQFTTPEEGAQNE